MSKVEEVIETTTEDIIQDETGQNETSPIDESNSIEGEVVESEVEDDGNDVTVSIGDPDPKLEEERKAPQWVKDLRKSSREDKRTIKELEAKLLSQTVETKPTVLGIKPTIEAFDYDAEKFETALEGWFEKKNRIAQEEQHRQAEAKAQDDAWQVTLRNHEKLKSEFKSKVKDFDESEASAAAILDSTQYNLVLHLADNSALMIRALGDNPEEAKKLASIKDYPKFVKALTRLEDKVKVTDKKAKPEPEKVLTGTGRTSGSVDSTFERYMSEAAKTGDYTKLKNYNKTKRNKT